MAGNWIKHGRINLIPGHKGWLFAVALVSLQLAVALSSSRFYFNSDTIFFLARPLDGLHDVWASFFQYDDRGNFRPLTLWVSSLLTPALGLHIWPYWLFGGLFHALNTGIFYVLSRRLTGSTVTAGMAAFFFGLHWVMLKITFGLVCLPDLCYVLFTLLSLLAFQMLLNSEAGHWKALSLLAALFAFLSKETAVIIPLLVTALCWVHSSKTAPSDSWIRRLLTAFRQTRLHWVLLALYLVHFAVLGNGSILPANPNHPYVVDFSFRQVVKNLPYALWLIGLPRFYDRSAGPSYVMLEQAQSVSPAGSADIAQILYTAEGIYPWIAAAGWIPVLILAVLRTFRRPAVRSYLPFCLALVGSLAPVLFLVHKQMAHNIYLATAGVAIWLALCLTEDPSTAAGNRSSTSGLREWAIFAYLLASAAGIFNATNRSWITHGALMAENAVADLQRALPDLSPTARLYFLKSKDGGLPWYYEGGNLFRIVLKKPKLSVYFQDRNNPLPTWVRRGSNDHIFRVSGTHLYDVTADFLLPSDRNARDLVPLFDLQSAKVDPRENYPRYDLFDTPSKGPVFAMPIHRFHLGRNALVLIAGTTIQAGLPALTQPGTLALGACLMLDSGDGVMGRLSLLDEGDEKILFESEFLPREGRVDGGWLDARLDLSGYLGRPLRIKLQTYNREGHSTAADWLAWSLVLMPKDAPPGN